MKKNIGFSLIQKNITLAQFDTNAVHSKVDSHDVWWLNNRLYGIPTLNYHENFNLLMPLVKQIESLDFKVNINGKSCTISNDTTFIEKKEKSKELSIFECCYEFISQHYFKCNDCGNEKNILRFFDKSKDAKIYCNFCQSVSKI